jgi:hypothetical protein
LARRGRSDQIHRADAEITGDRGVTRNQKD